MGDPLWDTQRGSLPERALARPKASPAPIPLRAVGGAAEGAG